MKRHECETLKQWRPQCDKGTNVGHLPRSLLFRVGHSGRADSPATVAIEGNSRCDNSVLVRFPKTSLTQTHLPAFFYSRPGFGISANEGLRFLIVKEKMRGKWRHLVQRNLANFLSDLQFTAFPSALHSFTNPNEIFITSRSSPKKTEP